MTRCGGMSLIELLVMLTVLAVVATLLLGGTGEMVTQLRHDETVARGESVLLAVDGDGEEPSRFIADMGRIPHVVDTADGKILAELWDTDAVDADVLWDGDTAFTNSGANAWPDTGVTWSNLPAAVTVPCGWRGPYLRAGRDEFYDGWGNEWQIDAADFGTTDWQDNTSAALGTSIFGVRSLGRFDTAGGTEWYDEDREFSFGEGRVVASLTVELMMRDGSAWTPVTGTTMDEVRVAVFAPYVERTSKTAKRVLASRSGGVAQATSIRPTASSSFPHGESASWEAYHRVRFDDVAPGPRKVYAYGYLAGTPHRNKLASQVLHVDLRPGSNSVTVYLNEDL